MASAELAHSRSSEQQDEQQQQQQDPQALHHRHHQAAHHHHRHPPPPQQARPHHHHLHHVAAPHPDTPSHEQQHHHHHRVHHHHHHHPSAHPQQSPPSSPFPPSRTDSPAFGMNKSSSPGTGAANGHAASAGGAPPQPQVISRTGRAGPPISASFQSPVAGRGPDLAPSAASLGRSAANGQGAASNTGQTHHHAASMQQQPSSGPPHSATAAHHLHHHPPSSTTSNGLPAGFGGPITVAEALSNVHNSQAAPGTLPAHTGLPASASHGHASAPWAPSAMANSAGPMSGGHPSNAIAAGPSTHPTQLTHGVIGGPPNAQHPMLDNRAGPGSAPGAGPSGHMMSANPGAGGGTTTEAHHLSLRAVIEHGTILNNEAAKESNFSIERRRNLPKVLQNLENETESCYSEIGLIAWNLNDYAKAFKSFENALIRNPFCLASLQGLARFYHEKASGTNVGSFANTTCTNGTVMNGSTPTAGGGIVNIEDNYDKVVDYASRALAIDDSGDEGEMWSLIGHAFLQLGQMPRAYPCYQQAIAKAVKKDDPKLWYGIGILYDRYGSVEHAEEAFASVLKLDPNFHKREEVFFRLGIIYKLQGKADASLECFHYILARPPEPLKAVDVWYQIGHAHELKRDLTLAKEAYDRVLQTTPDHSKVLQHLGGIYLREHTSFHNPQKCIDYISQSLEHDSTDPFSWYLLGRAFMQQNNYGKAYEAYQQAVYRDGKNPAYWCSIGVLYFNINQYHDALDAYTRAVRIHPFIPEIWQNLGILYESCHDQLADATDAYQRASQLDPANVELERRLKEVRNALRTGNEITTAPPAPQDIMPDSKSWQSVHMDVSGAKPVYLDSKSISQHPSPTPEAALGLSGLVQGRPGPSHHRGSPSYGMNMPPSAYAAPGGPQDVPNGRRRSSFTRPGSAHAPSYPGLYPEDTMRSRQGGLSSAQLPGGQHIPAMGNRPAAHSLASTPSGQHDLDRDLQHGPPRGGPQTGRMAPSSNRSSAYPGERHSPHAMNDPAFRHAISPSNSPHMRAAEYDYQMRSTAVAQGSGSDAMYERERQLRQVEREHDEQRIGSRSGLHQQQQQQQQRRPPPPPTSNTHGPADTRLSMAYGHGEYPPGPSRRPGSPPTGPGSRQSDERPLPGRAASGSSRPAQSHGYPYDYYSNGPPGYPDPRRDPRFSHDPRHDYAEIATVKRERVQAEQRDRQARRPPNLPVDHEDDERRRRDMERNGPPSSQVRNGRRDMSPGDMVDVRERDLRRPPPHNDGPGSLPSMRTVAPARGPGGHHPAHLDQGRSSFDDPQKAAAERRKQYRHPEDGSHLQHPSRQSEQNFDDETDMANALIGLAGGAAGGDAPGPSHSGSYRAGEKRHLSPHDDVPFKKARGQGDMGV